MVKNPTERIFLWVVFESIGSSIKEISYNNLLDIDSAINLMSEFYDGRPAFGIFKHNNACGFAVKIIK